MAVIIINQIRKEILCREKFLCIFIIVEIKLMAPKMDDLCNIYIERKLINHLKLLYGKILEAKGEFSQFLYHY